jgi:hypothetical protein
MIRIHLVLNKIKIINDIWCYYHILVINQIIIINKLYTYIHYLGILAYDIQKDPGFPSLALFTG